MSGRGRWVVLALAFAAAGVLFAAVGASAHRAAPGDFNWLHWGNTPDQNRYSPAAEITPSNVGQLGRTFIVDLNKLLPGIKKGQQSYPLEVNGTLYFTSANDQVFAVNATTGDLFWKYAPNNLAVFQNFGIVANRGVAYCNNRLFLLTLDMTIVALDANTGKELQRVPIANAVPGAYANYGYSETSAPICYNGTLIVGAAGSDYGVRGFTMAYHANDLTPAWSTPLWTIPPAGTEWRKGARIVGGCTNWTPSTVDPTTNTLYIGTAAASPAYYPSLRPGPDPRCTSLLAIDLKTGKLKWWQQQLSSNQWAYDSSQPPLVYTTKIGGKDRRVVSIATMEGMWFAYDAATGQPIWQRVKVIDNVEHPDLQPGKTVAVYPSSLGGLNYSPASFDPQTGYVYNAAAETAVAMQQATPAQVKQQQLLLGNTFLGLANGDFGAYLQSGWRDYGSVSAIDVATGTRVWKFTDPEPERGGPTTTAGGVGFVGDGDGNLRAFDVKTGSVLWKFQTGRQIAAGPTVYTVNGKEYIAITVGGTVTSSSGGTVASQLQVFTLGADQTQSPSFTIAMAQRRGAPAAPRRIATPAVHVSAAAVRKAGTAVIIPPRPIMIQAWNPNTNNTVPAQGRLFLGGKPVAGVRLRTNTGWLTGPTDSSGAFTYPVDNTMPLRYVVTVADASGATIGGRPAGAAQKAALAGTSGAVSVGYSVANLTAHAGSGGNVVVSGRLTYGKNQAPLPVGLYSYLLKGKITYADGSPVKNAVVTTRTNDHKFWTYSRPTGATGQYDSFLVAADQEGDDPVPMTVGVAVGNDSYQEPLNDFINFAALKSAELDIQLPAAAGAPLVKSTLNPQTIPGAIYEGIVIGVVGKGHVIKPGSATWPDANGNFQLVLPSSAKGLTVKLYEEQRQFFSTATATPGGAVDLSVYPHAPATTAPQGIATLKLPS
jgi:PQQ-dependent dehydrogenase (methanol/ethanol family)